MISAWHLLWIVPLTTIVTIVIICACIIGREDE